MSETASKPNQPANALLDLVVTILTLMFLTAAGGNADLARQAALETIREYRARTNADLITMAKIVGFGLAALAAISLSMTEGLSVATILRLLASANASDRSEYRNRQALKRSQVERPTSPPEPPIKEAALAAAAAEIKPQTAQHRAPFATPPRTAAVIPGAVDADSTSVNGAWYRAPGWPAAARRTRLMPAAADP